MGESSTRFCPFCGTEIQLNPNPNNNSKGITGSTILKGVGVAVAIPCAAATLAGFGAGGIVAGSVATMWQASIGNVAAGSAFATLQSIGATGGFYSGMAYGGTAFGAGKLWEFKNNRSQHEEGNAGESGDEGGDEGARKDGSGKTKNSADSTENEPAEDGDGEVSLTCHRCGRTFTITMPTSTSTDINDEVGRIAQ